MGHPTRQVTADGALAYTVYHKPGGSLLTWTNPA